MSLLAIVTFDLHGAVPSEYPRVNRKLANLGLEKRLCRKGAETPTVLPANTFARRYATKCKKDAPAVRNDLCENVRGAIASLGLRGNVFVAVGGPWAWGTRRASPSKA
jgi:hypothetical protein